MNEVVTTQQPQSLQQLMNSGAVYREIKGYEGLYLVSDLGEVFMCGRKKKQRNGSFIDVQPKRLSQFSVCGYKKVKLRDMRGNVKMVSVHRIVAEAFIENPHDFPQVNHKNENKEDNRASNLEWCTPKYNSNYGTGAKRCAVLKMRPIIQMNEIGEVVDTWPGVKHAAKALGIQQSSISSCLTGKLKHAGGFRWKYLTPTQN